MSKHKFSVIIPVYNREKTISDVLQAVLNQHEQDFEIVIMNDGSTDSTLEVVQSFESAKIKVFNQKNQGCSTARRNGCSLAQGDWLAFCDSDDLWSPDYLSQISRAIDAFDTDVVFTNYIVEGEHKPRIAGEIAERWLNRWTSDAKDGIYFFSERAYSALLDWQPTFPSAFVINRNFYSEIGGIAKDLEHIRSEDNHLVRRAAVNGKFSFVDKTLVTLGRQDDNLSSDYLLNLCGGVELLERLIEREEIPIELRKETKKEIYNHYREICDQAYWNKDSEKTLQSARALPLTKWKKRTFRNYVLTKSKSKLMRSK